MAFQFLTIPIVGQSANADYADLLPSLFEMNARYFLLQLASEPDKERVYKLIGENIRKDARG